jgi:hypothetical protein
MSELSCHMIGPFVHNTPKYILLGSDTEIFNFIKQQYRLKTEENF